MRTEHATNTHANNLFHSHNCIKIRVSKSESTDS